MLTKSFPIIPTGIRYIRHDTNIDVQGHDKIELIVNRKETRVSLVRKLFDINLYLFDMLHSLSVGLNLTYYNNNTSNIHKRREHDMLKQIKRDQIKQFTFCLLIKSKVGSLKS